MGVVIYNGLSSLDYGIQVEHPPDYAYPKRDVEEVHIPGRNGNLIISKNSYQNVVREYKMASADMKKDFVELAYRISEWLHSADNYVKLEDSYEPEYYRLATYIEENKITNILCHAGRATIKFNCKPQRFLKTGDKVVKIKSGDELRNPTRFQSKPIITVYGQGDGLLRIGDYTVSITNIESYMTINSEIQDVYKETQNCNSRVIMEKGFPLLVSGNTEITFNGGISRVEIIPKWWSL